MIIGRLRFKLGSREMARKVVRLAPLLLLILIVIAPTKGLAEGWYVRTDFDTTTPQNCQRKAKLALEDIAGVLKAPGKRVVYGYDLDGQDPYDAIIICQSSEDDAEKIAVVVVVYDTVDTKTSRKKRKEYAYDIIETYFSID